MPFGRARHVRVFPAAEVTRRSEREVDPRDAGLGPRAVEAIWRTVEALYDTGLHPAMALCIRYRGQIVMDRAIGHVRGNEPGARAHGPRVQATPDSRFSLFSASKVAVAMLVHLCDERGLLRLDDPVAAYIPGFGRHGKERMTLRHLLTHRAGIPTVPGDSLDLDLLVDQEAMVRAMCAARPQSPAGRRLQYHPVTGGFILAEVIERVTGTPVRQLLDEEVRAPLGLQGFTYGVPAEEVDQVAPNVFTGPRPPPPYSWLLHRAFGVDIEEAIALSNDPRFLTAAIPSANIFSTAEETCRFFELLLREGELDGVRLFCPETIRRAVTPHGALELDTTLMLPVRYGLGFMLGGDRYSPFGLGTPRAFGHVGFTNIIAWADPERELSVAFLNSGKPFVTVRALRWIAVILAISRHIPRR